MAFSRRPKFSEKEKGLWTKLEKNEFVKTLLMARTRNYFENKSRFFYKKYKQFLNNNKRPDKISKQKKIALFKLHPMNRTIEAI